jgi:hypothetical protein
MTLNFVFTLILLSVNIISDDNTDPKNFIASGDTYTDSIVSTAVGVYKKYGIDSLHTKVVVIDFRRPLDSDRLFVVDIKSNKIIKSSRVCHGIGSGSGNIPERFSNKEGSKMSSKGVFRTGETYYGTWGYSLKVDGLEIGINSNARSRAIIFHNADKQRAFWSWGCFSMPKKDFKEVIDLVKNGNIVFAFSDKKELLQYIRYK